MKVVVSRDDKPDVEYRLPQHVLIPVFEERELDGLTHQVARLPFFGLIAYGDTKEAAAERVSMMLKILHEAHAKHVLAGDYTAEVTTNGSQL